MLSETPLVLGFDTSAAHCAAALLRGDRIVVSRHEDMAKGQAERLMVLLQDVVSDGGISLRELTAIGVGTGPGNFTGIRISVAAARGLALSLGVPAIGVSMLEAVAEGTDGPVLACLDARRDQVYVQGFGGLDLPARQIAVEDIPPAWAAPSPVCIGTAATALARRLGLGDTAPALPCADAIARIAAARCALAGAPRAAPTYLRAVDAAPARDSGPVILS